MDVWGRVIQTGTETGPEGTNDGDNIILMDLSFKSPDWTYTYTRAIDGENYSGSNELHRLELDSIIDGNGSIYLKANSTSANVWKIWDTKISNVNDDGARSIKLEGVTANIENFASINNTSASIMTGQYTFASGNWNYLYFTCDEKASVTSRKNGTIQCRGNDLNVNYMYAKDHYYGVELKQDYYYSTIYPEVHNISLKNIIIEGCSTGLTFGYITKDPDEYTTDSFDSIEVDGWRVIDPLYAGVYLVAPHSIPVKNLTIKNALVTGSSLYGLCGVTSSYFTNVKIENCIFTGSGTADIYSSGTMSNVSLINNIYQTESGLLNFATLTTNYDIDDGDPFVGDGDYSPTVGASTINAGTTIADYDSDILGNDIVTIDIGPFEYGGENYNWTNR